MNLFKKTWTRGGKQYTSKKWYVSIDKKHVPLSTNKKIAEDLAAQLLGKRAAGDLNLKTRNDDESRKPLAPFVNDWAAALETKGSSKKHVSLLKTYVNRVLTGCEFSRARDFDAEKALRFVSTIKIGAGETERDASLQSKNFHIAAMKQFARWLVKRGVILVNRFADLEGWNVKLDRRHDRRELSDEEVEKLLATTEEKGMIRRQFSAADRSMLYRLALSTGLRASELASLTRASFDLSAATVTVQAGYTKNRALAVQPIPPALLPSLTAWLSNKPENERCWAGTWAKVKAAGKMMQADLLAAGVPYEVDGRFADFHSLRHGYISRVVRSGVNPRLAQSLARHSTITLTMDRYAHVGQREREAAVAGFPVPGCKQDASSSETREPLAVLPVFPCGRASRLADGTRLENGRGESP